MPIAFTRVLAGLDISQPFPGRWEIERRRGRPYRARLGANECLFGVSPAAMRVAASRAGETAFYCDPTITDLREAIARSWRCSLHHVVVAEGIEGLLGLFVRALIEPGDVAATSLGAYPSFDYYVRGAGGQLAYHPYLASGSNDLDGLLQVARSRRAKLLYLANPDNPTGAQVALSDLRRLLDGLPDDCLLLLDEAYIEFAAADEVLPPEESRPNLVRLRTFSKVYGLAGARVGYAVASPEIVSVLDRIRQHFAVSKLSQEMALAALFDQAFVAEVLDKTREGREQYRALAERIGAVALPSSANFVAFDFGDAARSKAVADWLDEHDVFVRRPVVPPLDRLIRITVGPHELRAYLAEVLLRGAAARP
jgi:histidinol-phosphate aminotransferase